MKGKGKEGSGEGGLPITSYFEACAMDSTDFIRLLQIRIMAYAHATEDELSVLEAVKNIVPTTLQGGLQPKTRRLDGHFGNPITVLEFEFFGEDQGNQILENIAKRLGEREKRALAMAFHRHVGSDGSLYLRFDKQEAFLGRLKLETSDPIHVRIKFALEAKPGQDVVHSLRKVCERVGLLG
ncbi:MAG: RNA-binding domain-containing protein [Candidatus Bathyarchaeia archaeon]